MTFYDEVLLPMITGGWKVIYDGSVDDSWLDPWSKTFQTTLRRDAIAVKGLDITKSIEIKYSGYLDRWSASLFPIAGSRREYEESIIVRPEQKPVSGWWDAHRTDYKAADGSTEHHHIRKILGREIQ
jgi:hypothetical protein